MKKDKIWLAILAILCTLGTVYYVFMRASVRIAENLEDFSRLHTLHSEEVSLIDLQKVERAEEGYSFLIIDAVEAKGFEELGMVEMLDADGNKVGSFLLLKKRRCVPVQNEKCADEAGSFAKAKPIEES